MTPQQAAITPNTLSVLNEFVANDTSDEVSNFTLPKDYSAAEAFNKRPNINLHFSLGKNFAYGVGLVESFFFFGITTTVVSVPFGLPFLFIFGGTEISFISSFFSGPFKFNMTQEVSLNSVGWTMFMGRLSLMCVSALGGILESTCIKLGFTSPGGLL